MVEHIPVTLPTLSNTFDLAFVHISFEVFVWLGIVLLGERNRPLLNAGFTRASQWFNGVARRRAVAVASIFLLVFVGRLITLPIFHLPPPRIQDEFSQLLSADTLASGRLTNPTHPMQLYLETFFVNQIPTYHSMYPIATGLFMAPAQVLTGQPWIGMLFAMAAASAGMCWMLQGWMAPRWALWGGLIFVALSTVIHATEHYMGEGIFVLGGVLILGAVPRLMRKGSISASICLGFGIALLACARPYEGAFLTAGIGLGTLYWVWKTGMKGTTAIKRFVLPVLAILVPTLVLVGYQNWRATGSALLAPYQLNLVQQHITRPLLWQGLATPPTYDHAAMASFYRQWEVDWWKNTRGFPRGAFLFLIDKVFVTYGILIWPLSTLVAVGSLQLLRSKSRRFLPLVLGFFFAGLCIESYQLQPRYAEPAWGLAILLALFGLRYIRVWRRRTRQGLRTARAATVLIPAGLLLFIGLINNPLSRADFEYWGNARQQLSSAMQAMSGKYLVLVRYTPSHYPQEEWVYNRADIDRAKIVWARDDSESGERDLVRYFADRTVWILEPDGKFPVLKSISAADSPAVSQVGPFQVSCGGRECEDLKQALGLVLDGESKMFIAEAVK